MATPSASEPDTVSLRGQVRAEIEAWFVRRGVPQLIHDYTAERRMDARAGPFVLAWLVGGSILWWGSRPDWPILANLAGVVVTLLSMALGVGALRRLRGQVMWWVDRRLEVLDTFSLGPLIALPSAVVEGSWLMGVNNGLNALLGMAVIYAVIGLGLGEIGWWSIRRLSEELTRIFGLLGRTLPILLVLVLFLLFTAELWEAAHLLSPPELSAVILLLLLVAAVLILTAFRPEIRAMETASRETMRSLVSGTPAAMLPTGEPDRPVPPLRPLQRLNLAVLVLIAQLIQSVFVALVVTFFLIAFGFLALPVALQERWIGEEVAAVGGFELLGEVRTLSRELLTMATLLGSVVGLYFTGLAVTDTAFRYAHFERMVEEVRQLMAARALYMDAILRNSRRGDDP